MIALFWSTHFIFTLDAFLIEVRTYREHHYISKYLSQHEKNSLWWIGATDSLPKAPKEGSFVWLTDQLEIKPFTDDYNLENQTINFQASNDNQISLWGPGQPDNWPNQVTFSKMHYAVNVILSKNNMILRQCKIWDTALFF